MHFSLKIWKLVPSISMILLRINWPNFVQFSFQLEVSGAVGDTYPAKTRGMGLLYGENCMINWLRPDLELQPFWLIDPCDGRTDGQTGDSI